MQKDTFVHSLVARCCQRMRSGIESQQTQELVPANGVLKHLFQKHKIGFMGHANQPVGHSHGAGHQLHELSLRVFFGAVILNDISTFEIHYFFDGVAAIMTSAIAQLWTSSNHSFKLWATEIPFHESNRSTAQYRDLHTRLPRIVQDVCLGSQCIVHCKANKDLINWVPLREPDTIRKTWSYLSTRCQDVSRQVSITI